MLVSLSIRNYALIETLCINFREGLNVLTGETGAGKSIIIGALSLALGDRASVEAIRDKGKKIFVQALFELNKTKPQLQEVLDKFSIDNDDNSFLITREISDSGKNICRVNDTLVSVAALKEISSELIDIHGQHEHQKLLDPATHLGFLDLFGKNHIISIKEELIEKYRNYNETKKHYDDMLNSLQKEKEQLEYYKKSLKEIKELNLTLGEDEELEKKLKILSNSEKLYSLIDSAYSTMYRSDNSVADILYTAQNDMSLACKIDDSIKPIENSLNNAAIEIEEALLQIRDYKDSLEFDPAIIDEMQLRLDKINSLKRKYGTEISDILNSADFFEQKINSIVNFDDEIILLKKQYDDSLAQYDDLAGKLSEIRKIIAQRFENEFTSNLHMLAMPNAVFKIELISNKENRSNEGIDSVQFLFSANMGQEPKSLSKIASGGEISRFMLAAKSILADVDDTDTMIFDEIDTGISGRTAQVVAEKMCDLSTHHQIICITHLPQLSSMADAHYLISKNEFDNTTTTNFSFLEGTDRRRELARMLGGVSVTETTIKHADEMIRLANEYKTKYIKSKTL